MVTVPPLDQERRCVRCQALFIVQGFIVERRRARGIDLPKVCPSCADDRRAALDGSGARPQDWLDGGPKPRRCLCCDQPFVVSALAVAAIFARFGVAARLPSRCESCRANIRRVRAEGVRRQAEQLRQDVHAAVDRGPHTERSQGER